jgi:hypothetical protein
MKKFDLRPKAACSAAPVNELGLLRLLGLWSVTKSQPLLRRRTNENHAICCSTSISERRSSAQHAAWSVDKNSRLTFVKRHFLWVRRIILTPDDLQNFLVAVGLTAQKRNQNLPALLEQGF